MAQCQLCKKPITINQAVVNVGTEEKPVLVTMCPECYRIIKSRFSLDTNELTKGTLLTALAMVTK